MDGVLASLEGGNSTEPEGGRQLGRRDVLINALCFTFLGAAIQTTRESPNAKLEHQAELEKETKRKLDEDDETVSHCLLTQPSHDKFHNILEPLLCKAIIDILSFALNVRSARRKGGTKQVDKNIWRPWKMS